MTLQRHIAQPSAVTRYAKLMAYVESRFNRHVVRENAHGADIAAVDRVVQEHVVQPCVSAHSSSDGQERQSVERGMDRSVRVTLCGRRCVKTKNKSTNNTI